MKWGTNREGQAQTCRSITYVGNWYSHSNQLPAVEQSKFV
jgi:hypothetical protein